MSDSKQFRQETREWLEANCPPSQRQPVVKDEQIWGGRHRHFANADCQLWFERMRDKGWTAPTWPTEYGGGGLSPEHARILEQEMARLGCRPPLYDLGLWLLGPALLVFGNEEQKREHIPKIIRGEVRWAQGYSEPSAGSDLASLKTRAEYQGDHFLVNGTKIWTTQADKADWIFTLVRTDPAAPKQKGISFLLIDMTSPGVSTTPIKLISGDSEFCQTFFDDVAVPASNLVGDLHDGWSVAKEVLKHERKLMSNMEAMSQKEEQSVVDIAKQYLPCDADGRISDSCIREKLIANRMNATALEHLGERIFHEMKAGIRDSKLPMLIKYLGTKELQAKDELLLSILGNRGLSWEDHNATSTEKSVVQNWAYDKAHTIAGGTSEIQLNIIAKRALGLPSL